MAEAHDESDSHTGRNRISYVRSIIDQAGVTQDVLNHTYAGDGTSESPYLVDFLPNDPFNPMGFSKPRKWMILLVQAVATLSVSFSSSAFSGGIGSVITELDVSSEVAILGVSMFVLGFAIGPLVWAPLSELYGRQKLFFLSYMGLTAFNGGAAGAKTVAGMIVLRFFAGTFGSSPLTNAGGIIADMFTADDRGIATSIFATAPFLGPAIGPIVGGFLGEKEGWRWVQGVITIFNGVVWIVSTLTYPETYTPVLLQQRAKALRKKTGKVYISRLDVGSQVSVAEKLKTNLLRPWILLFKEPIVLILSIYMALIYGTLFLCFAAFPIVFQQGRRWSPGIGGLAFLGLVVGMTIAVVGTMFDNKRYAKISAAYNGAAPPEARLPPALIGSILIPAGMFWFAWTNGPSVHWIVSIIGSSLFGAGIVLVFLSLMGYLIDSYLIYAASALAANSVIRSVFGAVFPLFTSYMYNGLGIHWASSLPAFLAVACAPFPFLFYRYGSKIRMRGQFASEAAALLERMRTKQQEQQAPSGSDEPPMEEFELERVTSSVRRVR